MNIWERLIGLSSAGQRALRLVRALFPAEPGRGPSIGRLNCGLPAFTAPKRRWVGDSHVPEARSHRHHAPRTRPANQWTGEYTLLDHSQLFLCSRRTCVSVPAPLKWVVCKAPLTC